MSRILIVANRLPLTVRQHGGGWTLQPSAGGLAAGLKSIHDPGRDLWIGWPGLADERMPAGGDLAADAWLRRGCVPVSLARAEVRDYYQRYSNAVVWPLLHSLVGRVPLRPGPWPVYERVNGRFADAVTQHYRSGDLVWIHDYQLMRVPALLRGRLPDARLGFFLHVPFPPAEIFSVLPERELVLEGLLGADLIGFHTEEYRANFAAAVERLLGIVCEGSRLPYRGRVVELGVFPLGVDFERFSGASRRAPVEALSRDFAPQAGTHLLVGVDRLDYTKGIPRRLLAFERFLELHPEFRGRVRLVQLGVPSRGNVPAYRRFRQQIDALVGRINGSFGTPSWAPVHYLVRSLGQEELIALYRATDVMVVTPVRDGMNLVAKEFVASRADEGGVLVLSEFAGAAAELREALQVNPYDLDRTAAALHQALTMAPEERRARMRALRRRVAAADARRWAGAFITRLRGARATAGARPATARPGSRGAPVWQGVVEHSRRAARTLLLLDYDGTLVPFAPTPELATPDLAALTLLDALAARPGLDVHLVSGRDRATLEAWLGHLPIGLHAEHGLWSRDRKDAEWVGAATGGLPRRAEILEVLEEFAARVPGALIEQKSAALVWHYRLAEPELAARQTRRLRATLARRLGDAPVDLLPGHQVLEVRLRGIDKGLIARRLTAGLPSGGAVVALGDDRTDEELFGALPPDALTVHVGRSVTRARLRVDSVAEARSLLWALAAVPDPIAPPASARSQPAADSALRPPAAAVGQAC